MDRPSSPESGKRWPFRRPWRWRPRRLHQVALLPTLITMGNGVCGTLSILNVGTGLAMERQVCFHRAAWLILAAMIFDALDGFVARVTRTSSAFGAQLDSLCDLITFGLAPAFLVFAVTPRDLIPGLLTERMITAVCVLYAMCAVIRLARFTVETSPDESSHREFAGLPSPAAAGVLAAAVLPWRALRAENMLPLADAVLGALPGLAFALGLLMVSRFRYAHMINRVLRGTRPFVMLVELTLLAALLAVFNEFAIFMAFLGYASTGPALWVNGHFFKKPATAGTAPTIDTEQDDSPF